MVLPELRIRGIQTREGSYWWFVPGGRGTWKSGRRATAITNAPPPPTDGSDYKPVLDFETFWAEKQAREAADRTGGHNLFSRVSATVRSPRSPRSPVTPAKDGGTSKSPSSTGSEALSPRSQCANPSSLHRASWLFSRARVVIPRRRRIVRSVKSSLKKIASKVSLVHGVALNISDQVADVDTQVGDTAATVQKVHTVARNVSDQVTDVDQQVADAAVVTEQTRDMTARALCYDSAGYSHE